MSMKKILVECFAIKESGPVFTYGLVKGLINAGADVYVCLCSDIENYEKWKELLPSDHMYFIKGPWSMMKHPLNTLSEIAKIQKFFKDVYFDYWIDTFPLGRCHTIANVIKYGESIGIYHDVQPHSSTNNAVTQKVENVLSKFDNIAVLSKMYIKDVQKKFNLDAQHVLYLRHGAMEYPFITDINDEKLYDINYLFFGRIEGYKGLHVLADAYRKLSEEYSNVSLTIAGSGAFAEYEEEYRTLERCVVLNRYISDEDISYLFGKPRTVVVLPYTDASQSGVIGMAFNYKVPVIVSDTGGLREQLFDGEMGTYAEAKNSADLYNKMKLYITDEDYYHKQTKLMEIGYQKSTWDYVSKEFLEQLDKKKYVE